MNRIQYLREHIQSLHSQLSEASAELKSLGVRKLSKKQESILRMIARGRTYAEIAERLQITKECLHTHCAHIRQKTHIQNTRDVSEVKSWLAGLAHTSGPYREPLSLTLDQVDTMRQLSEGKSYDQISKNFGIKRQSVQNHISKGCKRAGITGTGKARLQRIREYLASRDAESVSTNPADY